MNDTPAMTHVACDLCGADMSKPFLRGRDWSRNGGETFTVVRCDRCGLVYEDPRPSPARLARYYDAQYDVSPRFNAQGLVGVLRRRLIRRQARQVTRTSGGPGALLEVGCGAGALLREFKALGWRVSGVEISAEAAAIAGRWCGVAIVRGTLDDMPERSGPFDVIVMKHVIEHLPSPGAALAKCSRLLKPGGRVRLWTPNVESLERRILGRYWPGWNLPRHLTLLSPDTVRRYAARAGLAVERIGFETLPNDWVRGIRHRLQERGVGRKLRRLVSPKNAGIMALFWPIAAAAAACVQGGRMVCVLRKPAVGR